MTKAYFCYEENTTCKWYPVVYYDDPPRKSVNGTNKRHSPVIELDTTLTDLFSSDGSPRFYALTEKYPLILPDEAQNG